MNDLITETGSFMTKQEAKTYANLVNEIVDGRHIKLSDFNYNIKRYLGASLKHAFKTAPMPDYNHKKYLEATTLLSIHGEVEEPSLSNLIETLKGFLK